MDHEAEVVGELEPDDLQQIAGPVRSDCQNRGWVGVGIEVNDGEGMVEGVADDRVVDAVPASRPVNLHITIS